MNAALALAGLSLMLQSTPFAVIDQGNVNATWDGSPEILLENQNAAMPQTPNGTIIFAYWNMSTQNNAGTISVTSGGLRIPGIKVRRAKTTVELRDGESFTIAGLLRDDYENAIRQFPFIGDQPILGNLFRSTSYQRNQTELVMVVTPRLAAPTRGPQATPADYFTPPSDFELFVFGAQQGLQNGVNPVDRALMGLDPAKVGVEGSYGHVLF